MVDTTLASSIERIVEPDIFGKGRCSPITLLTSVHPLDPKDLLAALTG